jgi:hypothetical protein
MTDYLLVHGAAHGAWCWDAVVGELERRGHRAVVVDLPVQEADAGAVRYAEVSALAARSQSADSPVAVGHSLAGLVIPLLPDLIDVSELVFLCSLLPKPGTTVLDQFNDEPDMLTAIPEEALPQPGVEGGPAAPEKTVELFYHDCPADVALRSALRLRPQSLQPVIEPSPVRTWPPTVRSRYIVAVADRVINPGWSRRAVPERLGIAPSEINGGHSPFLARPGELVDVLLAVELPAPPHVGQRAGSGSEV